jgi:hypothetical protein
MPSIARKRSDRQFHNSRHSRAAHVRKLTGFDVRRLLEADARATRDAHLGMLRDPIIQFVALVACLATIVAVFGFLQ